MDDLLERIANTTEAAFWERRRQVKARGYPEGWTETRDQPEPGAIVVRRVGDEETETPA
jgi:hypothetical protein